MNIPDIPRYRDTRIYQTSLDTGIQINPFKISEAILRTFKSYLASVQRRSFLNAPCKLGASFTASVPASLINHINL